MSTSPHTVSAHLTRARFDSLHSSVKYAGGLDDTPTHRRELRCLAAFLQEVGPGSRVLDLPCGTGRLLPFLHQRGYQICAADSSQHMLDRASELALAKDLGDQTTFSLQDVLETSFDDQSMDAVVCNRLFHHFAESETRINALKELRRISRGPIVVSFFCSRGLSAWWFLLKNRLRTYPRIDRVPISFSAMTADATAAGLRIRRHRGTKPLLGKQHYLELCPV